MSASVVFVGMSGVGKTVLSEKIESEAHSFTRVGCDDLIEERIRPELEGLGYKGIHDVAKWMGQPFDTRYMKNSATYLSHEKEVMMGVIARLRKGEKLVVDTTGSVIYTGETVLRELKKLALIILMDAGAGHQDGLYKKYIAEPKPVIWGDNAYRPRKDEDRIAALCRCYPELLRARNVRYRNLAHSFVDFQYFRKPEFNIQKFLREYSL